MDIKEVIINSLEERKDLFSTIELIKNHIEQKKESLDFDVSEMEWLRYKVEFLPIVLESPVCCGVIYWLNKDAGTNPYVIAKRLGVYYRATDYWIKKLQKNGLIVCSPRMVGMGNSNRYYLNKKLKNVSALIIELIHKNFGDNLIKIMHKNYNKQFDYIKKWRSKNPKKVRASWKIQNSKRY